MMKKIACSKIIFLIMQFWLVLTIIILAIHPVLCPIPIFQRGGLKFLPWDGKRQGKREEVEF